MNSTIDYDVIIIGGGLVGAAAALALSHAGLRLALVEAAPAAPLPGSGWDTRIYAISPGNARFLDDLGIWHTQDQQRIAPIESMQIWGDAGSQLVFDAYDANVPALGYIVEGRQLQHALWTRLQSLPDIALLCPAQCVQLTWEPERVSLALADSRVSSAQLVVGADGGTSWTRAQAGIGVETDDYRQMGVVANFTTELPHRDTARQWFINGSILAWLPLPGNRISMVWSTATAHAQQLLGMSADALCATVAQAGGNRLGAIALETPAAAFPLRLQSAEVLAKPRLALIGDAAHLVHPLAGQGVNLGFHDVTALAQIMTERHRETDVGDYSLLRRYERSRKADIAAMQAVTHGLHGLFSSAWPGIAKLRNWGMDFTNRQQWLKQRLMAQAII